MAMNNNTPFWASETTIGELGKSKRKKFVVTNVTSHRGEKFVNVREWYFNIDEEEWFPTKKGVVIPAELTEQLCMMLHANTAVAESKPAVAPEPGVVSVAAPAADAKPAKARKSSKKGGE